MPARIYDPSLVNLPRGKRYIAVSHDCSEHNATTEERAIERAARRATSRAEPIVGRYEARRLRRGRITQTKETCAPAEKLLKRALGPHVTAPGFHHDPRVMAARSAAALERRETLAALRDSKTHANASEARTVLGPARPMWLHEEDPKKRRKARNAAKRDRQRRRAR